MIKVASKYDYIKEVLKENVLSGKFLPSSRIPTEPELAKTYKVGRNTLREAVSSLVHEGLLIKKQGKGTFVAPQIHSGAVTKRASNQIGLVCFLRQESFVTYSHIQNYLLEKNGLLTVYNMQEDNQDPLLERKFLDKAEMENFLGVIILPTPLEPLNTDVYRRLRDNGIKVALIAPYAENMDHEVTFFYDYFHAGYMAVAKMGMAGFKNICYARNLLPISHKWLRNGIVQAVKDLGLSMSDDFIFEYNKNYVENLKKLPPKTGIVSSQTSIGFNLYEQIERSGLKLAEDIALCSRIDYTRPGSPEISGFIAPDQDLFIAAIDYVLDDTVSSTEIIHETFKFKYEEHGTIEK